MGHADEHQVEMRLQVQFLLDAYEESASIGRDQKVGFPERKKTIPDDPFSSVLHAVSLVGDRFSNEKIERVEGSASSERKLRRLP